MFAANVEHDLKHRCEATVTFDLIEGKIDIIFTLITFFILVVALGLGSIGSTATIDSNQNNSYLWTRDSGLEALFHTIMVPEPLNGPNYLFDSGKQLLRIHRFGDN